MDTSNPAFPLGFPDTLYYEAEGLIAGLNEITEVSIFAPSSRIAAWSRTSICRYAPSSGEICICAFAMLEVSDSLILAQKADYWPITKAIYELFQRLGDGPYIASALGVWAMLLLTLTILSANAFLGKRLGAIFRV